VDLAVGLKGLKLTDEDLSFEETLAFQWRQRYYRICNDLILWAPVNYLTFHVLVGDLAFYGNVITALLLAGDFILSTIKIWEKISTFNKIYAVEQQRLIELNLDEEEINAYLLDLKNKHELKLKLDYAFLTYQFFLIVAFVVLCSSSPQFVLIGAVSCFLLQLVVNQIDSLIKLSQMTERSLIQQEYIKMVGRLFLQLAIPALFLVGALLFPTLSPLFIFTICLVIDVGLYFLIHSIVQSLCPQLGPDGVDNNNREMNPEAEGIDATWGNVSEDDHRDAEDMEDIWRDVGEETVRLAF
jgi:hypothetical protein